VTSGSDSINAVVVVKIMTHLVACGNIRKNVYLMNLYVMNLYVMNLYVMNLYVMNLYVMNL
jgi:hypothetical protein